MSVHPDADDDLCQRRHVRNSLVTYAKKLPGDGNGGGGYTLQGLVTDLIAGAKSNLSSNTNVIPVLQALNALLEADALERLCYSEDGLKRLDERSVPHWDSSDGQSSAQALLSIVSRGVSRLKSVHRIQECMRTCVPYIELVAFVCLIAPRTPFFSVVNLLALPQLSGSCIPHLVDFLTHQYPTVSCPLLCSLIETRAQLPQIRTETARYLYLFLQSRDIGKDTDEAEELLLETEWFVD